MKYYFIELKDKRINLRLEEVEKVFKALDNEKTRFLEIGGEKININFIKGIFRDYEKEDMEEKNQRLKKEIEGQKENKDNLKMLGEMKKDRKDLC
mgnify:FL=1